MDKVCPADHAGDMKRARTPAAALFRRVVLINGLIFTLGTLILALSPATVSARIKATEIPVLVVGLAVMLTANALLLRTGLAPLLKSERTTANASALAAQENERQRIARELHDEIGQTLTVALLILKRAVDRAPAEIRGELADTQEAVRAGLDEVRGIARRLRPDALEDLGLHSALNALCSEFTQATGIAVVKHVAPQYRSAEARRRVGLLPHRAGEPDEHRAPCGAEQGVARPAHHRRQLTLRIADDGKGGAIERGRRDQRHARAGAAGERRR